MEGKFVLEYIIHSSLFVGFIGVSMILTTTLLFNLPISWILIFILFLTSFSIYSINRIVEIEEDAISHTTRANFVKTHYQHLKIASILAYITAMLLGFYKNLATGFFVLIPLIIVILYSVRWVPKKVSLKISRLKEIFIIKNVIVAFTWAFGVTLLPFIFFNIEIQIFPALFVFTFIFLKVLINTITFDVRDIKGDKLHKTKTIPIKLGIKKTKKLLSFINLLSFLVILIPSIMGFLPSIAYFVSLVCIYTQLYIYYIGKRDIKFLTDVMADGEYIIIGLLALIGAIVT